MWDYPPEFYALTKSNAPSLFCSAHLINGGPCPFSLFATQSSRRPQSRCQRTHCRPFNSRCIRDGGTRHGTAANSSEANFQVDLSGTAPSVQPSESAGATSADASGTHLLPPTLHAAAPISEISVTAALPEQSPPVDDDATPGLVDSDDESETLLPSFSSQQTQSCPDHPDSAEPSAGPRYTQFSDASSSTPAPSAPPSARGGTTMANINSLSNNLAGFDLERILTQVTSTLATSITTSITQSLTVALQFQSPL